MENNTNTQCTSACGNDYDCPHEEESETETMTRQEQLDLIRAACIEANPSDTTLRDQHSWQGLQINRKDGRPVRLADVLLAHSKAIPPPANVKSKMQNDVLDIVYWWNLRQDDLTAQSDECVAFLAGLLAKN